MLNDTARIALNELTKALIAINSRAEPTGVGLARPMPGDWESHSREEQTGWRRVGTVFIY